MADPAPRSTTSDDEPTLLDLEDVTVAYPQRSGLRRKIVRAVRDVSLTVAGGQTTALVGESGSGKSTTVRAVAGIAPIESGQVRLQGVDLATAPQARSRLQMVFQNPYSSLNPRRQVKWIIEEPMVIAGGHTSTARRQRVEELMADVGLDPALGDRRPGQLSGGQSQRVAIARALAVEPSLLLLDEPLSALDVSVQAQVMTMLARIQEASGIGYLFVTHDLSLASMIADEVVVLYLGKIMECGPVADVFARPAHPYTQALLSAVPDMDDDQQARFTLRGEPPSPSNPPSGCPFRTRCPGAQLVCAEREPELSTLHGEHKAACHFPDVRAVPAVRPFP